MKSRLLLIALLASYSVFGQQDFKSYSQTYVESNFGVAYIDLYYLNDINRLFPGCSFLIGNRKFLSQETFIDSQIGLAFPSIGTAKIGIGKYNFNKGRASIIGIRIWPTHIYIQQNYLTDRCSRKVSESTLTRLQRRGKTRENLLCGEWTFSLEVGVPEEGTDRYGMLSLASVTMATIGYRIYFD